VICGRSTSPWWPRSATRGLCCEESRSIGTDLTTGASGAHSVSVVIDERVRRGHAARRAADVPPQGGEVDWRAGGVGAVGTSGLLGKLLVRHSAHYHHHRCSLIVVCDSRSIFS
jgi:hypothetical protein